jgi:hypothetical protein
MTANRNCPPVFCKENRRMVRQAPAQQEVFVCLMCWLRLLSV